MKECKTILQETMNSIYEWNLNLNHFFKKSLLSFE